MRSQLLFVLTALLTTTCSPVWVNRQQSTWYQPANAYVCIQIPHERYADAAEAVKMWDRSLSNWRRFVPVEGSSGDCTYNIYEVTDPNPEHPFAIGWCSMLGGREVFLMKGRYEVDVTGIVLHEMGHLLGAQHVDRTLMNPNWKRHLFACPDLTTVAQVAAWNKVNLETLSWCYW